MAKIGKTLSYINTERKGKGTGTEQSSASSRPFVGPISAFQGDYLLKSIWDKVFEIRTDSNGTEYIFGKLPVVTQYGITMYGLDENLDIPSIYAGIPVDGTTIIKREDGTLMVNPNIKLGGASNWDELEGKPSWIGSTKPSYSYSEIQGTPDLGNYALRSDVTLLSEKLNDFLEGSDTDNIINKWKELEVFLNGLSESDNLATILSSKVGKDYVDGNFVTLATAQSILGEKDFVGGLKVNGSPIYYDTEKKYWKFEGDLLVTGGVTMYGNDSEFIPSTIMDAILYDDATLGINSNGELYVKGSIGGATTLGQLQNVGTWADSVADVDRIMYQQAGSSNWVAKSLSSIGGGGGVSGDYLPLDGSASMKGSINWGEKVFISGLSHAALRIDTPSGYIQLGPQNTSYCHIYTDRDSFYFNKSLLYANGHTILHSGNYSSYALPLTGGKISDSKGIPLIINSTTTANALELRLTLNSATKAGFGWDSSNGSYVYESTSNSVLGLKTNGTLHLNGNTIWHSGNDGSGSGLDADLFHGKNPYWYPCISGSAEWDLNTNFPTTCNTFVVRVGGSNPNLPPQGAYGNLLNVQGSYSNTSFQLFGCSNVRRLFYRSGVPGYDKNGLTAAWKEIAFTDSNVASATKLQTARTIWGQSFDGTGNVDGAMTINTDGYALYWGDRKQYRLGSNGYADFYIFDDNPNSPSRFRIGTGGAERMTILANGNVGIGTTSPSKRLDIYSSSTATGNVVNLQSSTGESSILYQNVNGHQWALGVGTGGNGNYLSAWSTTRGANVFKIDTSANLLVYGGITMYSDQRKKTILNHVELSLKQIADAPLIEHFYNSDDKRTTHVGSIAQYWASMNDWFCKLDSEGYYTMEIQNCALASAISIARELDRYESKTDKTINKLKKKIALLEEEVEQLRSRL